MIPDNEKCRLRLIGITYNQIESGVYALILQEEEGEQRHIPIIIGFPEAQSIECRLQEVVTPRPLTHDLMANILSDFGITLLEVDIHRLESGVFAATLVLESDGAVRTVDSRSSDGIALAIRTGSPIYTSRSVVDEVGFIPGDKTRISRTRKSRSAASAPTAKSSGDTEDIASTSLSDLYSRMEEAARREEYELAARIKEEIIKRGQKPDTPPSTAGGDSL